MYSIYNYSAKNLEKLDSVTVMGILNDSSFTSKCDCASMMLDEVVNNAETPWVGASSSEKTDGIWVETYENNSKFLYFSDFNFVYRCLISNVSNYTIHPSCMDSYICAYNRNGWFAGTQSEGEDEFETGCRVIYLYEVGNGNVKDLAVYNDEDSIVRAMFWGSDNCLYVRALKPTCRSNHYKYIYYKLTFKKN